MEKTKPKRSLGETSPDFDKYLIYKKTCIMGENSMTTLINTLMPNMNELFDSKLANIATKDDINTIKNDIIALQVENETLKSEITKLKANENTLNRKIEDFEKFNKRLNIVVNGLTATNTQGAKQQFDQICSSTLNVSVTTNNTRKIGPPSRNSSAFVFELGNVNEVNTVLSATKNLRNSRVFINRDLSYNERREKYHLRQIKKSLIETNPNLTVEIKRWAIEVNEHRYKCSPEGVITAFSDAELIYC